MEVLKKFIFSNPYLFRVIIIVFIWMVSLFIPQPFDLLIITLVSLIVVLDSYFIRNKEQEKLKLLQNSFELLKIGELTNQLNETGLNSNKPVDNILLEFNTTISYLNAAVTGIIDCTNSIHQLIQEITKNSIELDSANTAQATFSSSVSGNVEQSAYNIGNLALTSSVNVQTLDKLFQEIKILSNYIRETQSYSQQAITSIKEISSQIQDGNKSLVELNEKMNKITESSFQIKKITEIIKDISDKINLLSLNASIEAARAGEYGRGFAVVAQEVSKLADQTANSIKDVDTLVKKNNSEIEAGTEAIRYTTTKFTKISQIISNISLVIQEVSKSMEKQVSVNTSVNSGIETLHQNYSTMNQLLSEQKSSNLEILNSIKEVYNLSLQSSEKTKNNSENLKSIKEIIENLKTITDLFKVKKD